MISIESPILRARLYWRTPSFSFNAAVSKISTIKANRNSLSQRQSKHCLKLQKHFPTYVVFQGQSIFSTALVVDEAGEYIMKQ